MAETVVSALERVVSVIKTVGSTLETVGSSLDPTLSVTGMVVSTLETVQSIADTSQSRRARAEDEEANTGQCAEADGVSGLVVSNHWGQLLTACCPNHFLLPANEEVE